MLKFHNSQLWESIEMHASGVKQNYSNSQFEALILISNRSLYSGLDIYYRASVFNRITLVAEQHLMDNQSNQLVFLNLTKTYLNALKTKKLIPDTVKGTRVWVRRFDNGEIRLTGDVNGRDEIPLSDEALQTICQDAHFEFEIDPKAEETRVKLGPTSISLRHPNIHALDASKILEALTGSDPNNPFIFPIQVNGQALPQLSDHPSLQ